jgi:uncharacterized membrane protein
VDPRRVSAGEWVAVVSALALLVALLLPWYSLDGIDLTGWQSFTVVDVLLAAAALLAIFGFVATAAPRSAALSVAAVALGMVPALLAAVIAIWRLVDPAPDADVSRAIGAWLGCAGAIGVALGAAWGMRDEGPERRRKRTAARAAEAAQRDAELLSLPREPGAGA